jgi:hypothetical protein
MILRFSRGWSNFSNSLGKNASHSINFLASVLCRFYLISKDINGKLWPDYVGQIKTYSMLKKRTNILVFEAVRVLLNEVESSA